MYVTRMSRYVTFMLYYVTWTSCFVHIHGMLNQTSLYLNSNGVMDFSSHYKLQVLKSSYTRLYNYPIW